MSVTYELALGFDGRRCLRYGRRATDPNPRYIPPAPLPALFNATVPRAYRAPFVTNLTGYQGSQR